MESFTLAGSQLEIKLVEGKELRDTEVFGKMDVFVTVSVGRNKWDCPVSAHGGKFPHFKEDSFIFNLDGQVDAIKFEARSKHHVANREIGEVTVPLRDFAPPKWNGDGWLEIRHSSSLAGHLRVKARWASGGPATPTPAAAPAAQTQQVVYVASPPPQQVVTYSPPPAAAPAVSFMTVSPQPVNYMASNPTPQPVNYMAPTPTYMAPATTVSYMAPTPTYMAPATTVSYMAAAPASYMSSTPAAAPAAFMPSVMAAVSNAANDFEMRQRMEREQRERQERERHERERFERERMERERMERERHERERMERERQERERHERERQMHGGGGHRH